MSTSVTLLIIGILMLPVAFMVEKIKNKDLHYLGAIIYWTAYVICFSIIIMGAK